VTEHVSDLRWDRLLAGDLSAADAATAREHAAVCSRCAARFAELESGARAFVVPRRRTFSVSLVVTAGALVAAAALVIVIRSQDPPAERPKGAGGVQLVLVGGPRGRVAPLSSGDRLQAGDTVQAAYTTKRDGFGAVLSRDGAGATAAYVPSSGDVMTPLPAGTMQAFPQSTVLDAVTGEEAIVVIWCEQARPLAPLIAELDRTGAVATPDDCTVHRVVIAK